MIDNRRIRSARLAQEAKEYGSDRIIKTPDRVLVRRSFYVVQVSECPLMTQSGPVAPEANCQTIVFGSNLRRK